MLYYEMEKLYCCDHKSAKLACFDFTEVPAFVACIKFEYDSDTHICYLSLQGFSQLFNFSNLLVECFFSHIIMFSFCCSPLRHFYLTWYRSTRFLCDIFCLLRWTSTLGRFAVLIEQYHILCIYSLMKLTSKLFPNQYKDSDFLHAYPNP